MHTAIVIAACILAAYVALAARDRLLLRRVRKLLEGRPGRNDDHFAEDFFPGESQEIAAKVREIIGRHINIDMSKTLPSDRLQEDLRMDELDSMADVECILDLEKEFGIGITDQEAQQLDTIEDTIMFVARKVNERDGTVHGN